MNAEPTEAQLRAVREGLERFLARGRWSALSPVTVSLPPFVFQWNGDETLGAREGATTRFCQDGSIVVTLRTSHEPAQLLKDTLHELMHVADAALVGRVSVELLEHRARCTSERLGWRY